MPYLLDGILIVCIFLFLAIGIHRGFAKSLVGLIGTIAAVVLAVGLSGVVAQWVYSSFFQPSLMQSLQEAVGTANSQAAAQNVLAALPGWASQLLQDNGVTVPALAGILAQGGEGAVITAEAVISPVMIQLLRMVAVVVLMVIFGIVVSILARVIGQIFRLPLLRQIDSLLGAAAGLLQGAVFCVLACLVLQLWITATPDDQNPGFRSTVEQSAVYQTVESIIPLTDGE